MNISALVLRKGHGACAMKRIAILHEELEWGEKELKRLLGKKRVSVDLLDVRHISLPLNKRLFSYNLVLNRVYASVANRSYENVKKTMRIVGGLEAGGITVVNSGSASKADYSKYRACRILQGKGILTPKTLVVKQGMSLKRVTSKTGFPVVIKRDCVGRAFDMSIAFNLRQAEEDIKRRFNSPGYSGSIIAQEFIKSVNDYDIKVCIVGGKNLVSAYKRTLIRHCRGKQKWAGILSRGSKIHSFDFVPEKLLCTAFRASKALKADINDMDIVEGKKGFYVIENNPTPGFNSKNEETRFYKKPERIAEYIYQTYLR